MIFDGNFVNCSALVQMSCTSICWVLPQMAESDEILVSYLKYEILRKYEIQAFLKA